MGEKMVNMDGTGVRIWDSNNYSSQVALRMFRDEISRYGVPWTATPASMENSLQIWLASRNVGRGRVSKMSTFSRLEMARTLLDISRSETDCFYLMLTLSGSLGLRHRGESRKLSAGDFLILDGSQAVTLDLMRDGTRRNEIIALRVPRSTFSIATQSKTMLGMSVISRDRLTLPLASCMHSMAERLFAPRHEVNALFEAILHLLPLKDSGFSENGFEPHKKIYREIICFIDQNLKDKDLSARSMAKHFGISERYIYKLFAERGLTFKGYVLGRRLNRIGVELKVGNDRRPTIELAYKWGFNDLSTFHRTFKKHFGRTPKQFRDDS
jgi:AraC family transcriptional regulator, positive regulator of tynA and feaB